MLGRDSSLLRPLHPSVYKLHGFGNNGKERTDIVKYSEKLVFPEHNKTPEKRTTIADVAYNLKAVIVHEGESISAGH